MPLAPPNPSPGKTRAIPLLLLAALGTCFCIGTAGWLHYAAAARLNQSRDWVEHSQNVLFTLQSLGQRVDRIEAALRIYRLNPSTAELRLASSNQVSFNTDVLHLRSLVQDNPRQSAQLASLSTCSSSLGQLIGNADQDMHLLIPDVQQCREVLATLVEVEREMLENRTETTRRGAAHSLELSVVVTSLSIAVVLTLFGFLLRDTIRRRRDEFQLYEANEKLASTIRALERQMRESSLVTSFRDELQLCVKPLQTQQCAARYFEQLMPGTSGSIHIINNSRHVAESTASWGSSTAALESFPLDACCGLRSGRPRWRRPARSEVHCSHFNGTPPECYLCLPLAAYGDTLGSLYIECSSTGIAAMVDAKMSRLQELVELTSISIAGLNLRSRLEHQSIRDSLTGLFNRHFMEIALDREIGRALRQQKSVAILMLDLDHFKQFNDTYGHEAGDVVLREIASALRDSVRSEDILCRYGGEELVAIMPELSLEAAMDRAEFLRDVVSNIHIRNRGEILRDVSMSVGVAIYPQHGERAEDVMRAADRALYEAKHRGRNRVIAAEALLLS
ncbi:diguanylate cyclase [Silvibacterium dinghuense]|uniref:diguanylate cyclase n=1 Tax=Silvibacterium dinghuense TaxID=1560006 RepID=A0A4Q1SHB3_9BACT|nr:diguanylate cyclase [Silvibacterium dinghuense]RXS96958.1 diguanylate cyclase [Silvibacterium dinghuense]GGG95037.1 GGDEF domain-containing protein [Silvibacterium dinghuense]